MTQKETNEAIKVMSAYVNGKKIQYLDDDGRWVDTPNPVFDWSRWEYRIKPESKYRPFKTQEECWNEMLKHQPFGWIICKTIGNYYNIEFLYSHKDNEHGVGLNLYAVFIDFETMFKGYNFADGTPFGIKEE